MTNLIKSHPFAIEAFFDSSIVFTFAVPKENIQKLVPECLILDTYKDKWAFIAIAMVKTKYMRPKGFPKFLGNSFYLIGYRIFVRYINNNGKNRRGLFILKSETDKKKMEILGNFFTYYKYSTTDIQHTIQNNKIEIKSEKSNFNVIIEESEDISIPLPIESPFDNWADARKFAGPLPFTFSYIQKDKSVLIVEGVRENWIPKPVKVIEYNFSFLDSLEINDTKLANAFIIINIPYYWKQGVIEKWQQ